MLPLLILLIAVFGSTIVYTADGDDVRLVVGRSTVLDTGKPIARVSLTSADIADALVTSTNELLINGKAPGTISMFVWDRAGAIRRYEVVVQRDITRLGQQLQELFPGESISAQNNGKSVVLSGTVTSKEVIERAVNVAAGYVEKKEDVVPLLQIQSSVSNQVLLRVRFAEVSRSALTELGASWFTSNNGYKDFVGRATTQQFPSMDFTERIGPPPASSPDKEGKMAFSDFLNLFLFNTKYQIGTLIKALQTQGLFQSLAEPNLVAESGKEASFLAGGEIPIPIAQPGAGGAAAITVQFKEFGIRLNFTPVVNGNRVHLKVRPEVSTLDFANAVTLGGFRIPALSTRRTETELELENGQTFAIAGLMNNQMNTSMQKIPGIGDIPILGLLFKSKAAQKNQTELVVMITPEILPNGSNGVTPNLPKMAEPFMPPMPAKKAIEMPAPAFRTGGRTQDDDAAAAAAKVSALTPAAPAVIHAEKAAARPAEAPKPAPAPASEATPAKAAPSKAAPAKAPNNAKAEAAAKVELKRMTEENSRQAKVAEEERRKADAQKKLDDKAAIEKAKRDAAAAKRQAEIDKAASDAAAKRAAEQAKKQAEIDKRQQKSIEEAQARLKAAEAAYQAEVAKKSSK